MITAERFRQVEAVLAQAGYRPIIEFSRAIEPPADADAFAERAIYVICNSGMKNSVATPIFKRCMSALREGHSTSGAFGHPGKRAAIDRIWAERTELFDDYLAAEDPVDFLMTMPWIGPVIAFHLAKNLGGDFAKPDVHMERLARRENTTTHELCKRLAEQTGYRVATIDTILWRACADGLLDSRIYELRGWQAAYRPEPFLAERLSNST